MWKTKALLLGLLCWSPLWAAGPEAGAPSPVSESAEAFLARSRVLDAELGCLDGGALTQALSRSAASGRALRVLLDSTESGARLHGRALKESFQALSPAGQVFELRWLPGSGLPERRLLAGSRLLRWAPGQAPRRDDSGAAAFRQRFEIRWAQALTVLPEALSLEDELKALPDPRDKDPHISGRKEPPADPGQAPSAGSGQAQDKEGTP